MTMYIYFVCECANYIVGYIFPKSLFCAAEQLQFILLLARYQRAMSQFLTFAFLSLYIL